MVIHNSIKQKRRKVSLSLTALLPTRTPCWANRLFYSETLKMGLTGCPETSVRYYHYLLRNNPEKRATHLIPAGSLYPCHSVHMYWTVYPIMRYVYAERYSLSFGTYVLNGIPYHSVRMCRTVFPIIRHICTERYSLLFGTYVLNGIPYHSVLMCWTVFPIIRYICTERYSLSFGTYVLNGIPIIRYICTERYSLSFGTYVLNGIPYYSVRMCCTKVSV